MIQLPIPIDNQAADDLRRVLYEARGRFVTSSVYAGRPVTITVSFDDAAVQPEPETEQPSRRLIPVVTGVRAAS